MLQLTLHFLDTSVVLMATVAIKKINLELNKAPCVFQRTLVSYNSY